MSDAIDKGCRGEEVIAKLLLNRNVRFVHDLYVKVGGVITQIDFVALTKNGVFCLEVKNYGSCIIKGDLSRSDWTANYYGKYVSFYNPFMQNLNHISKLRTVLNFSEDDFSKVWFHNVTLFSDSCQLKLSGNNKAVFNFKQLDEALSLAEGRYEEEVLDKLLIKLNNLRNAGKRYRLEQLLGN